MAIVAVVTGIVVPVIGPLIVWAVKREESRWVAWQALQTVAFGVAGYLVLTISMFLSMFIGLLTCGVGILLFFLPLIWLLVEHITALLRINAGMAYEFPLSGRFVKF